MFSSPTRRSFVSNSLKLGALAGLGDFAFLGGLPAVSADEARPQKVRLTPDIEPLVRLIEDTPREKLIESVAGRIRGGTSYQELLTGLFLAGVRGIQPRPVGYKFHAVLVVNSAHLASLAAPDNECWLPLLWALDNFKESQVRNRKEGNWSMAPADEAHLPPAHQARARFHEALDTWDVEGVDRAVVSLTRNAGANEVIEAFWQHCARDFRDIGHKVIYTANAWRALQTIGWRHAEPVLRSLAYALQYYRNGDNPAKNDYEEDRPGRENRQRLAKIRKDWELGTNSRDAAADLLGALRTTSYAAASDAVVAALNRGVGPASVWDALFLRAGELLMQQPTIVGLHCVTSINALHYGFQASGNDETRRFLTLQAAAFLALFYKSMNGKLREDLRTDTLEKAEVKASGPAALEEVFADVSRDKVLAARKILTLVEDRKVDPDAIMTAARRLIFNKGHDSHDYKFSSAALEDFYHATPAWRNRYLATSVFHLYGTGDKDNQLIHRARAALSRA